MHAAHSSARSLLVGFGGEMTDHIDFTRRSAPGVTPTIPAGCNHGFNCFETANDHG
jgi:hypothetical protein